MAIGNAPWPIGVTMVGIHARTGREKIFAQHVARILFMNGLVFSWFCFCEVKDVDLIGKYQCKNHLLAIDFK